MGYMAYLDCGCGWASCCGQVWLVLWRHVWLSRIRRHYLVTLLELAGMLLLMSSVWDDSVAPYRARPHKDQFFDIAEPTDFWGRRNESWTRGSLAFAPDQPFFADLVARVCKALGPEWIPMPFEDAAEAAQFADEGKAEAWLAGDVHRRVAVWFQQPAPDRLIYHVRFPDADFDLRQEHRLSLLVPGPANTDDFDEIRLLLPLQYLIESTYLNMTAERLKKQINITEMVRRAGLGDVAYYMGHMFESGFVIFGAILLMYVPLFVYRNASGTAFLEHVNPLVFMQILCTVGAQTIMHAMVLAQFLWEPSVAFAAAVVYWLAIALFPYAWLQNPFGFGYYLTTRMEKMVTALSPCMLLHWCLRAIERFEKYEVPLSWRNMNDNYTTLDNVGVRSLCAVGVIEVIVMAGVIFFLDNAAPWGYGVPKPLYFFFSIDYWSPYKKWNIRSVTSPKINPDYFEPPAKSVDPVVNIIDLCAKKKGCCDLDNVNLTIYKNQVTVILGPHDSGHTTVLDVLTGMIAPTSGEAYICNYSATSPSGITWQFISVCPEESELFDDLTIEENMRYFLYLRGVSAAEERSYLEPLFLTLYMKPHRDTLVSQLSPQMKRALCVSIVFAVYANFQLVILSEPSRLMDPRVRNHVWETLGQIADVSSVLVTTQSIEEAEMIADRLIVMREGRIVCAGSPTWLKKKLDSGFCLRLTRLANFKEQEVKRVVYDYMGSVEPRRVTKVDMVFNLSEVPARTTKMTAMLQYLEKRRSILGIAVMSLSYSTLEDVYIKMVTRTEAKDKKGIGDCCFQLQSEQDDGARKKRDSQALKQLCQAGSSKAGTLSVLWALLRKRTLLWARVWWTRLFSLGIPVTCLVLLVLCERLLLPQMAPGSSAFTYEPERIYDVSYGFIESDNASKDFSDNVLLPLLSEHSVHTFAPTSKFVERELLFWAEKDMYAYLYEYQYGISTFQNRRLFVWFNGQCPPSAVIGVNLLHTALLRNLTGSKDSHITLVNWPPVSEDLVAKMEFERLYGKLTLKDGRDTLGYETELFPTRNFMTRVLYAFFVSLAMSFYAASHVFAPMVESGSGFQLMQLMTGMSGMTYWMGHFIFDMFMAVCNSITLVFIIFISHMEMAPSYHLAILALFVANAFSSLPLAYLFSRVFSEPVWAFSYMVLGLLLAGIVGSLGVELLNVLVQDDDPSTVASVVLFIWGYACRWFPTYTLVRGIVKVILLSRMNAICLTGGQLLAEACRDVQYSSDATISRCCEALPQNDTAPIVGPLHPFYETGFYEFVSMVAQGMLYIALLALVDSQVIYSLRWYAARRLQGSDQPDELSEERGPRLVAISMDTEVEREVSQVNQVCCTRTFSDAVMVVRSLQKTVGFINPEKLVDAVSLLLKKRECVGIVGINGCGKTTLLETLVGVRVPTYGNAYTSALSLVTDIRGWQRGIGYAADRVSKDSMPALTVGELLDTMARLRGVAQRRQAVTSILALTGRLREDQMANQYSRGELKMLLIACAAVGVPPVMMVDEPYSDVEPLYRNEIIRMLQLLKDSRAISFVLTSHRMSHFELLCDRVAIMDSGTIQAMGDGLQMDQKYGRCYSVTIKLPAAKRNSVTLINRIYFAMMEFHQCTYMYNYKGTMLFVVGKPYTTWAELFAALVAMKDAEKLPEFSVSDITLEQIYVGLSRRQILFSGARTGAKLSGMPSSIDSTPGPCEGTRKEK
ncbi:retinal-specific phospholipid-transporting ATPase ABCA4-like [Dermacentor silvarum]|uniref:retinal-specific phospholipid-transporting ATPase ABCA4-like n=1 Tax=Dermacentor silvarum TaxID=543639 RepID=UPI0021016938|nr:retinal-specific phospholipid-transporting ATPase ABCA4-like [Dermacentor silvarum]